ncbi:hypothetical protein AMECASPLE_026650 [Ameca splendens]|uniref:Uncharacterized protein n=1 Tax=Ameca splendens TaxID=208324 RepID=A0ABV0YG58_9TELE
MGVCSIRLHHGTHLISCIFSCLVCKWLKCEGCKCLVYIKCELGNVSGNRPRGLRGKLLTVTQTLHMFKLYFKFAQFIHKNPSRPQQQNLKTHKKTCEKQKQVGVPSGYVVGFKCLCGVAD